jgi:hypothetical protein
MKRDITPNMVFDLTRIFYDDSIDEDRSYLDNVIEEQELQEVSKDII